MAEYIKRESLRKDVLIGEEYADEDTLMTVLNLIDCAPAESVRENIFARWKKVAIGRYACSFC